MNALGRQVSTLKVQGLWVMGHLILDLTWRVETFETTATHNLNMTCRDLLTLF